MSTSLCLGCVLHSDTSTRSEITSFVHITEAMISSYKNLAPVPTGDIFLPYELFLCNMYLCYRYGKRRICGPDPALISHLFVSAISFRLHQFPDRDTDVAHRMWCWSHWGGPCARVQDKSILNHCCCSVLQITQLL